MKFNVNDLVMFQYNEDKTWRLGRVTNIAKDMFGEDIVIVAEYDGKFEAVDSNQFYAFDCDSDNIVRIDYDVKKCGEICEKCDQDLPAKKNEMLFELLERILDEVKEINTKLWYGSWRDYTDIKTPWYQEKYDPDKWKIYCEKVDTDSITTNRTVSDDLPNTSCTNDTRGKWWYETPTWDCGGKIAQEILEEMKNKNKFKE